MRSLLVIIDGLGDDHIPALNGLTPFQYAEHKNIDTLIKLGTYSEVSICENDFIPESLSCIARLVYSSGISQPIERIWNCWRMVGIFRNMRWCYAVTWFQ